MSPTLPTTTHRRPPPPPPFWIPVAYLSLGLASLLSGLLVLVARPERILGGLLAPATVGLVHLITLGFLTATILGSLYLVSPFALRARIVAGPIDVVAALAFAGGTVGVVHALWTGTGGQVGRSLPLVLGATGWVCIRSLSALGRSPLGVAEKVPFVLAWFGFLATAALGALQALDRSGSILGGSVADRVAAHAHLGIAGWLLVMVLATGNRLLPMILPSAMPIGRRVWIPSALVAGGAALHAAGRLASSRLVPGVGIAGIVAGLGVFLATVLWMLRNPRRPATDVPRPDLPRLAALSSLVCAGVAGGLGLWLAIGDGPSRLPAAYGVLVLLGVFGQLILAVELRLLPWLFWMHSYARSGHRRRPPTPYRLPWRPLQWAIAAVWAMGPWVVATGVLGGSEAQIRVAAVGLALAILGHGVILGIYAGQAAPRRHDGPTTPAQVEGRVESPATQRRLPP